MAETDRKITQLAETQHALVTKRQLGDAAVSRSALKRSLASARLTLVHDNVYRIGGAPTTTAQLRLAAVLAVDGLAAVSHRAAADLYGLWWSNPPAIEITTTDKLSPELDGVTVHRLADLQERWITSVDGVPCTTVARTLVDLGAVMPDKHVDQCLDRALGRGIVSVGQVKTALDAVARRGRRGAGVIRRVLEPQLRAEPVAGVFEARMARLLSAQGLPPAVPEYEVWTVGGAFVARVDFAYPDLRLAIEVDGFAAHSSVDAFRATAPARTHSLPRGGPSCASRGPRSTAVHRASAGRFVPLAGGSWLDDSLHDPGSITEPKRAKNTRAPPTA
jgi:hypothetical protein